MVDTHWGRVFTEHVGFSLSVSFHQYSVLVYTYMLADRMGRAWEPSGKWCFSGNQGVLDKRELPLAILQGYVSLQ
jgi:hypothetical protein